MLYAISSKGKHVLAYPEGIAYCPKCKKLLIPRCGKYKIWHWAHRTKHKEDTQKSTKKVVRKTHGKSLFDF